MKILIPKQSIRQRIGTKDLKKKISVYCLNVSGRNTIYHLSHRMVMLILFTLLSKVLIIKTFGIPTAFDFPKTDITRLIEQSNKF